LSIFSITLSPQFILSFSAFCSWFSILSARLTIEDLIVVDFLKAVFDFFLVADLVFDHDFETFPFVCQAVTDPLTGASFYFLRLVVEDFHVKDFFFGL